MKLETKYKKTMLAYNEAIEGIKDLQKELIKAIEDSGIIQKKFSEKLGLKVNTYYRKKRELTFTIDEMSKIMNILTSKII